MKFTIAYKAYSISLSFLVLLSTLSLTIEKHFCGDTLIDVAIFTETEKCSEDVIEIDQVSITKNSCCKDEIDIIEGLSEMTITSFEDLDVIQQHVLFTFAYSYSNLFENLPNIGNSDKDYSPPILVKDIQVLDETYLI
ncbi:HYC_CC_PP family protein [Winogradskyella bathintestinalis]|uniref:Secreted protein n=1 Tax=Winogradskyella bathintestinalis TaxID=3035208 RepID=A0ABT7ZVL0_9FLAO|nr:hypothetical protein [Winogradskyella bathintestinalis]MDN3492864.1 hypothetical protein [Winogradskyella bathintestinalis]